MGRERKGAKGIPKGAKLESKGSKGEPKEKPWEPNGNYKGAKLDKGCQKDAKIMLENDVQTRRTKQHDGTEKGDESDKQ